MMQPFNILTHALWSFLCFPCLFYLWKKYKGNLGKQLTMEIFALSALVCYTLSAIYHTSPYNQDLHLLDIVGIHLLIMGSYTPVIYWVLSRPYQIFILIFVYGTSIISIGLEFLNGPSIIWIATPVYLFTGWAILIAYRNMKRMIPNKELSLLIISGLFYTFGAAFNVFTKLSWRHEIFHVFVMTGTLIHLVFLIKVLDKEKSAGEIYVRER